MNSSAHSLRRNHWIFGCLLFLALTIPSFFQSLAAQSGKIVSGVVLDQDGKAIVGATVMVPRSNIKTSTDSKGNFSLNVPEGENAVVITFKGMRRQNLNVSNKTSFIIRMEPFRGVNRDPDDEDNTTNTTQQVGQRVLAGTVKDESGTPVSGATVQVKVTGKKVSSDAGGNFLVEVPRGKQTLLITSVNLITKEVEINAGQTSVIIDMQSKNVNLNEVVVVGYGTQKKVNLTGAVSSVSGKDLQNIPQASIINLLSGRLPGVSIIQPGGEPGNDQGEIVVRGVGTLNNSEPLVVIDGVVSNLSTLNNINPVEIANITVLKDASSAAIYGARGANGVILVTTKEPSKSKLNVNLNLQNSFQKATYLPKFVNSWQFMQLHNEATGNINYPLYAIDNVRNGIVSDTFANADYVDAVYKTGMQRNANVTVSGGAQSASFQGSFGVIDQDGVMNGFSSTRYNYRGNVRVKTGDKTDLGINFFGYFQDANGPWADAATVVNRINQALPITPVKYADGNWGVNFPGVAGGGQAATTVQNPLLTTMIGRRDRNTFANNINSFFSYRPVKNLFLRTSFNYSVENVFGEAFNPTYDYRGIVPAQTGMQNQINTLQNTSSDTKQYQVQFTANYNKILSEKHSFNLLGGYEFIDFKDRDFFATGQGLPNNDQQVLGNATVNVVTGGDKNAWRTQSFFGRFNYSFDNKYLLEGNLRVDGSSRFPSAEKYGLFPSFSAGWIISKEKFFDKLSKTISLLKFRGGWGVVGNDRIGNYPYQQVYSTRSYYPLGEVLNIGVSQNNFANNNLKWEETSTTNFGVDAGFLNNKLIVNFDVFSKITNDILYQRTLPGSFGNVNPANLNIAKVANRGWELNVEYRQSIASKVFINIAANVAYVNNKVLKVDGRDAINGPFILREGFPINSYYILVNEGLYTDSSQFTSYPVFNNNANSRRIGALKFIDQNKDGLVNLDDRVPLYSANTPYTFGGNLGIFYKGFDINIQLQGVSGKWIYTNDNGNRPGNAGNTNFWKEWWDNRYDPVSNPNGTWPVLKRQSPEVGGAASTFFLLNASYVRIKNMEFGYAMPASVLKRLQMRTLRFYFQGNNLFTFSKLIKQIDPERASNLTTNTNYPQLSSMSVGLNVGF
jgi:TonB-linked SusC/RagA family outer membrane protein